MEPTYRIVRRFQSDDVGPKVIDRGLSLDEAKAHCRDPETSSRTCTSAEGCALTQKHGAWFDSFEEE